MTRFADAGFSVHTPIFFDLSRMPSTAASAVGLARICISREFHAFITRGNAPAAAWVRNLARHLGRKGRKVGVVGMCFTGGLALAAVAEDAVGAAVAAQPAMPWANGPWPFSTASRRRSLGLSAEEEAGLRRGTTPVLALRFDQDPMSPRERVIEIDQLASGCVFWVRGEDDEELKGHPTLTAAFRGNDDELASASQAAIAEAISFLNTNLQDNA